MTNKANLKILILRGLPGSGKSTYCRELMKSEPNKWKHINKDALREMIDFSVYNRANEEFVDSIQYYILEKALFNNSNILFDNCNLRANIIKQIEKIATEVILSEKDKIESITIEDKIINTPIEECIARDAKRTGIAQVGAGVIRGMYEKFNFKKNGLGEPRTVKITNNVIAGNEIIVENKPQTNLPKAIIVDLDGTIAKITNRPTFDASNCHKDEPVQAVVDLVQSYYKTHKIIFLSGREEKDRKATEQWLNKHVPTIQYELYLRPTGDKTKDNVYKKDIYFKHIYPYYYVQFVIDDRPRVCRMFREQCGLLVFQLNHIEF